MKMKMQIKPYRLEKITNRLVGFNKFFRGRFLLLKNNTLTFPEYVLWDFCYSVLADWDVRHATYGSFDYTNAEIASFLGCHTSTVSRNMNALINKGFIISRYDGLLQLDTYDELSGWVEEQKEAKKSPFIIDYQGDGQIAITHTRQEKKKPDLFGNTTNS